MPLKVNSRVVETDIVIAGHNIQFGSIIGPEQMEKSLDVRRIYFIRAKAPFIENITWRKYKVMRPIRQKE